MKSSLKLMNKEQKEKRPGAAKKLDVPLVRRQQDRLDRSVAYTKTNETLDRWTETVKHNRRAEHLVFPLPETTGAVGLNNAEIQPLTASQAHNELESAVLSIMDQSGLSLEKPKKEKEKVYDEDGNELTRKEIQNKKRLERDLQSREAKRAARIKKIKSKAYHRVHRRQREREEMAAKDGMAGEIDSEEEREAHDRRRALERVGQRHRESKWAKLGNRAKRAVWDEEFRTGLTEMARQGEELRRRKEGKRAAADSDDTSSSGSDSEDGGDASLRRQLEALEKDDDDEPKSGLMSMKFMQKAEAARKKENDELIRQMRQDLYGEDAEDDDEEPEEIGRRQFGAGSGPKVTTTALDTAKRRAKNRRDEDDEGDEDKVEITLNGKSGLRQSGPMDKSQGIWSQGKARRSKGSKSNQVEDLDLVANSVDASKKPAKSARGTLSAEAQQNGEESDSDHDHLPLTIRDQALVARAFGGGDVVAEFEQEKEEMAEADDDKIIDNTLPGWGSWVGEGVSAKEQKRHQGRFVTKVEGIKKKDRKDAKLDKVIINEKRIKKVRQTPDYCVSTHSTRCTNAAFLTERPLPSITAAPSLLLETRVRALAADARRPRVADQDDAPGQHQAPHPHEAGHHQAHVEAHHIETPQPEAEYSYGIHTTPCVVCVSRGAHPVAASNPVR
jgi:U3 small nucleolar RNA-associated protein 14